MSYHVDSQDLLRQIGFNSLVAEARESLADVPGTLARVIEHSRSNSVIHTGAETFEARSMPALTRVTPIVVGDWVLAASEPRGEWWISGRLTPYTEFHRIDPSGARQALVTNVDSAFLVMGLDGWMSCALSRARSDRGAARIFRSGQVNADQHAHAVSHPGNRRRALRRSA